MQMMPETALVKQIKDTALRKLKPHKQPKIGDEAAQVSRICQEVCGVTPVKQLIITDGCQHVVRTDPGTWTRPNSADQAPVILTKPRPFLVRLRMPRREVLDSTIVLGFVGTREKNRDSEQIGT